MKEKERKPLKVIANAWRKLSKMVAGFLGERLSSYAHQGELYILDEPDIRRFIRRWRSYFGKEFSDLFPMLSPNMNKARIKMIEWGNPTLEVFDHFNRFEVTWIRGEEILIVKDKDVKETKYKIYRNKGAYLCQQISLYEETFQLDDGETMLKSYHCGDDFIRWKSSNKILEIRTLSHYIDDIDDSIVERITKEVWSKVKTSEYVDVLELVNVINELKIGTFKFKIAYRAAGGRLYDKISATIDGDNRSLLGYSVSDDKGTYEFDGKGFTYQEPHFEVIDKNNNFQVRNYNEKSAAEFQKVIQFGITKHSELFPRKT